MIGNDGGGRNPTTVVLYMAYPPRVRVIHTRVLATRHELNKVKELTTQLVDPSEPGTSPYLEIMIEDKEKDVGAYPGMDYPISPQWYYYVTDGFDYWYWFMNPAPTVVPPLEWCPTFYPCTHIIVLSHKKVIDEAFADFMRKEAA